MASSIFFSDYSANKYLLFNAVASLASAPIMGYLEYSDKGLKYSKFAQSSSLSIPSKLAMFLYYAPAAAISGYVLFSGFPEFGPLKELQQPSLRFLLLVGAIFIHFSKRVLEVLFLHKYSGSAELISSVLIVFIYTFAASSMIIAQRVCEELTPPSLSLMWPGLVVFLIGISGNFYHHFLLAQLRSPSKAQKNKKEQKRYVVPHGGFFELVACPHYLFEVIDFCGLAMISQSTTGFTTFILVAIYLSCRSVSTRRWYQKKVDGFPENRKAILPFVL